MCSGLASPVAHASPLRDSSQEWAFAAARTDTKDVGTFLDLDFQWQWNSPSGRHQVGVLASYEAVSPDDSGPSFPGSDFDAIMLGPVYTFNWTPGARLATGLAEISLGEVEGDAREAYETYRQFALGAKVFAGDSAAVTFRLFGQVLSGTDSVDDLETTGISVGISFFTGQRPAPLMEPREGR